MGRSSATERLDVSEIDTKTSKDKFSHAHEDVNSLGNILLAMGYVTEDQLRTAVEIQKTQSPIGEILLSLSPPAITLEQLEEALMLQKVNRGEATDREAGQFYRKQKKRLMGEVVDCLKEATAVSMQFQAKISG